MNNKSRCIIKIFLFEFVDTPSQLLLIARDTTTIEGQETSDASLAFLWIYVTLYAHRRWPRCLSGEVRDKWCCAPVRCNTVSTTYEGRDGNAYIAVRQQV